MKKISLQVLFAFTVYAWISGCADLGDPAAPDGGSGGGAGVDFAAQIQPIFDSHCVSCHASPASPSFGDLDLSSYTGLMDSIGPNAPVVVAGDADASYLVKRIEGTVTPRMPLGGSPLSAEQITLIRQWINEGAQATNSGNGGEKTIAVPYQSDKGELVEKITPAKRNDFR